jgi:hypothetical protein
MPDIDTAQSFCHTSSMIDPMADWLVKSAIPCVVWCTIGVKAPSSAVIDTAALADAVATAVNSQSFVAGLNASIVINAVQSRLPVGASVQMPIQLVGRIIKPDRLVSYETFSMAGQTVVVPGSLPNWLISPNELIVPIDHSQSLSPNTVAFFTDSSKIQINLKT